MFLNVSNTWSIKLFQLRVFICSNSFNFYCYNRLIHWDIDNENLHGGWFEETTGIHNLQAQMFIDVNKVDPTAKLFINDYDVVRDGILTVASNLHFKI